MRMRAGCELSFDIEQETPIITMLRARRSATQRILNERLHISPELKVSHYTDAFGNACQRFTAPPGPLRIAVQTTADIAAQVDVDRYAPRTPVSKLPDTALQFTLPSRYCPSDKLLALATDITRGQRSGYGQVQAICEHVHERLDYRYGVSNASTDALETLTLGAGICRDFTHVAIALCRSLDIPARIAVGYLHNLAPMDLHAWFEAYVGDGWYTFDPTEDALEGGRIVLAYGRDAADVAFLTDFGALKMLRMNVWAEELPAQLFPVRRLAEAAE